MATALSCNRVFCFARLRSRAPRLALVLAGAITWAPASHASDADGWIGAWTASVQPAQDADFAAESGLRGFLWNRTIRQVARISIGGSRVRIAISNEYGKSPLRIGDAHVALAAAGGKIQAGTDRAVTFGGGASIVIPAGAPAISDPVDLTLAPLAELSVSLFLPDNAQVTTAHLNGRQTAYVAAGDRTADVDFKADSQMTQRPFLSEIFGDAAPGARAIVAFGDSITDGEGSTIDANARWPDRLAERLVAAGGPPVAVLNEGISGDKLLTDGVGANGLARFERDALGQLKADTIILMIGINDIGWPGSGLAPHEPEPSAAAIIAGYKQMIARAHLKGVKIIGATLTPFAEAFAGTPRQGFYTPDKEKLRLALNAFIRSGAFDAVVDFERAIVDPGKPQYALTQYASGDHLHPNDAGYAAMAKAIDLSAIAGTK
jgi:lysophospholipase L1-like esterase